MSKISEFLVVFMIAAIFSTATAMDLQVLPATGSQPTVVSPQGRVTNLYRGSFALLISVSNYSSKGPRQWPQLRSTEKEMDDVATALREHGFTIWRATDPTGEELALVYRNFIAQNGHTPDNRLIFFFSGHGYTNPKNDFAYLVPVDAPIPDEDAPGFFRVAYPLANLETYAKEIESRHALFLFDSCFSGAIFLTRKAPESRTAPGTDRWRYLTETAMQPVRQFISAGGAKEELPGRSVFSPLFIQALSGAASAANDMYVSGREIGIWIEQQVPQFERSQHPHSGVIRVPELAMGDVIFQAKKGGIVNVTLSQEEKTLRSSPFFLDADYELPYPYNSLPIAKEFDKSGSSDVRYVWKRIDASLFPIGHPCYGPDSYIVWFFQDSFRVRRISIRIFPDNQCRSVDRWVVYLNRYFSIAPAPLTSERSGFTASFDEWVETKSGGAIFVDLNVRGWDTISIDAWKQFVGK